MLRRATLPTVALLVLVACAPVTLKHTAIASEQLALSAERLQALEIELYHAGEITRDQHATWQQGFLKLGISIQALNQAIRAGQLPVASAQIRAALDILDAFLPQLTHLSANDRVILQAALDAVRLVLVSLSTQVGA